MHASLPLAPRLISPPAPRAPRRAQPLVCALAHQFLEDKLTGSPYDRREWRLLSAKGRGRIETLHSFSWFGSSNRDVEVRIRPSGNGKGRKFSLVRPLPSLVLPSFLARSSTAVPVPPSRALTHAVFPHLPILRAECTRRAEHRAICFRVAAVLQAQVAQAELWTTMLQHDTGAHTARHENNRAAQRELRIHAETRFEHGMLCLRLSNESVRHRPQDSTLMFNFALKGFSFSVNEQPACNQVSEHIGELGSADEELLLVSLLGS